MRKPEPRFYEIACELLGVDPHECVFLDDLGINLKPAAAMGMTTIKVEDPAVALAELSAVLGAGPVLTVRAPANQKERDAGTASPVIRPMTVLGVPHSRSGAVWLARSCLRTRPYAWPRLCAVE